MPWVDAAPDLDDEGRPKFKLCQHLVRDDDRAVLALIMRFEDWIDGEENAPTYGYVLKIVDGGEKRLQRIGPMSGTVDEVKASIEDRVGLGPR